MAQHPSLWAASKGHVGTVQILLTNGANIQYTSKEWLLRLFTMQLLTEIVTAMSQASYFLHMLIRQLRIQPA